MLEKNRTFFSCAMDGQDQVFITLKCGVSLIQLLDWGEVIALQQPCSRLDLVTQISKRLNKYHGDILFATTDTSGSLSVLTGESIRFDRVEVTLLVFTSSSFVAVSALQSGANKSENERRLLLSQMYYPEHFAHCRVLCRGGVKRWGSQLLERRCTMLGLSDSGTVPADEESFFLAAAEQLRRFPFCERETAETVRATTVRWLSQHASKVLALQQSADQQSGPEELNMFQKYLDRMADVGGHGDEWMVLGVCGAFGVRCVLVSAMENERGWVGTMASEVPGSTRISEDACIWMGVEREGVFWSLLPWEDVVSKVPVKEAESKRRRLADPPVSVDLNADHSELRVMLDAFAHNDPGKAAAFVALLASLGVDNKDDLKVTAHDDSSWETLMQGVRSQNAVLCARLQDWRKQVTFSLTHSSLQLSSDTPDGLFFVFNGHQLTCEEVPSIFMSDTMFEKQSVKDLCVTHVRVSADFVRESRTPFWIVGCFQSVFGHLAGAAGWKLKEIKNDKFMDQHFALYRAYTRRGQKMHVLRAPPGRDVIRSIGQAHVGYLKGLGLEHRHVRCFTLPDLTEDLRIFSDAVSFNEVAPVLKDSIVILGLSDSIAAHICTKGDVRLVSEGSWTTTALWGWQKWKRLSDSRGVVVLSPKLPLVASFAEVMAKAIYDAGAVELIWCSGSVATRTAAERDRDLPFCPEHFLIAREDGVVNELLMENSLLQLCPTLMQLPHLAISSPFDENWRPIVLSKMSGSVTSLDCVTSFLANAAHQCGKAFGAIFYDPVGEKADRAEDPWIAISKVGESKNASENLFRSASLCRILYNYLVRVVVPTSISQGFSKLYSKYRFALSDETVRSCRPFSRLSVGGQEEVVDVDTLFSVSRKKIMLEGDPGSGVSTICSYLAHTWALGCAPTAPLDIVVRGRLKILRSLKTFTPATIIGCILSHAGITIDSTELETLETFAVNGLISMLWMFEGLDEAVKEGGGSEGYQKFLAALTKPDLIPWLENYIVTTRRNFWKPEMAAVTRVTVLPLESASVVPFIRMSLETHEAYVQAVTDTIDKSPVLQEISLHPLTLRLMCIALRWTKTEVITTRTKIYEHAFQGVMEDLLKKLGIINETQKVLLKDTWTLCLISLARMHETVFTTEQLVRLVLNEYKGAGITFQAEQCFEHLISLRIVVGVGKDLWAFAHETFWEFYKAMSLREGRVYRDATPGVLCFLAGLTKPDLVTLLLSTIENFTFKMDAKGRVELFCDCLMEVDSLRFELSRTFWPPEAFSVAVEHCAKRLHWRLIRYFLDRGAVVTPGCVRAILSKNRPDMVRQLLSTSTPVDVAMVVSEVARSGQIALLEELLSSSHHPALDVSQVDLFEAAAAGQAACVVRLAQCGAGVSRALHGAVEGGHLHVVTALLAAQNIPRDPGFVLLHAARCGNMSICQWLFSNTNVSVNHCDSKGWTALHFAAKRGQLACVEFLLSKGANRMLRNKTQQLAYDLATDDAVKRALM